MVNSSRCKNPELGASNFSLKLVNATAEANVYIGLKWSLESVEFSRTLTDD